MGRRSIRVLALCVSLALGTGFAAAQSANVNAPKANGKESPAAGGGERIAGTVVSKVDGHPLAGAQVGIVNTKPPRQIESMITDDDGKFAFSGLPAGKFSLQGLKRGFIGAAYDQHDAFSTAIVTGAGIDTEHLVLKLAPNAVITGRVLDEAGEPVRRASVNIYVDDHASGIDQVRLFRTEQSDDLGIYEAMAPPGTYLISVNATPWYAVHPPPAPAGYDRLGSTPDRSLDVAYPVTYYADVTDAESATPIPVRGGERVQVDLHLNPVPALNLIFHSPVPSNPSNGPVTGREGFAFPQLELPGFAGTHPVQTGVVSETSPGVWTISGVPAGRYNIRLNGPENMQINGVEINKDGEEIDESGAQALSSIKISVHTSDGSPLPKQFVVGLRSTNRSFPNGQMVDEKGQVEVGGIAAGHYEVVVYAFNGRNYSVESMSAEGAEVSGHSFTLTAGSSPVLTVTVVAGSAEVNGIVKRAGKGVAGAMVVLVPKDPQGRRDLFRRDQSDLDGTFSLRNVVPGSYTVLAIDDGWEMEWSQPEVISAYLKRGRKIEVTMANRSMDIPEAIEVQSK